MAEPKIRFDDFVRNVHPDPAKPEPTILLSGFIGPGLEGHVRIYPDLSLNTWYEVADDDVLHSAGILAAGSGANLGGSHVWLRASARIKPGSTVTAAPAAAPAAVAAAAGLPQPTPATHCFVCPEPQAAALQPTPATRCFICPPLTQECTAATVCTIPNQAVQPTPTAHVTLATVCTQLCTMPQMGCVPRYTQQLEVCGIVPSVGCTQPAECGIVPPSLGCTQYGCAPNTAATVCTQPPGCPAHTVHNTLCVCPTPSAVQLCGPQHTAATACMNLMGNVQGIAPTMVPNCTHQLMCQNTVQVCRGGIFSPYGC